MAVMYSPCLWIWLFWAFRVNGILRCWGLLRLLLSLREMGTLFIDGSLAKPSSRPLGLLEFHDLCLLPRCLVTLCATRSQTIGTPKRTFEYR